MTWEEQRDRICELNSVCIDIASDIINGNAAIIKGRDREGGTIEMTPADGLDMLARCSTIAKQWTSEIRAGNPTGAKPETASDDQLVRKAKL